jgi:hypothetical protein
VTVSVRCSQALGAIRQGEAVPVVAGEPVRIEFELKCDLQLN